MMTTWPLLSLLIWTPILCGVFFLFSKKSEPIVIKKLGVLIALFCFGLCLPLMLGFNGQSFALQWTEKVSWIPSLHIYYALGVDGFSVPLIVLTCFMTLLVSLAAFKSVQKRVPQYLAAFFILQGLLCGAFSAVDGVLFYVFWEAMLVPMFLIIGIWGGEHRIYASMKFFIYTFLGSVLLLIALIYLHGVALDTQTIAKELSFDILSFQTLPLDLSTQKWLFIAFLIAFAVKVPMWPVHTWLPDAHVEAPTGGSVMLAAILLKMGGYGFLRFILPITPDASAFFALGMICLSLIAIVYIGLVALVQKDMKTLIAYSSISHMGFVTLGFFLTFYILGNNESIESTSLSIDGAMVQMISHGFVSGALFLCVGVLYDRLHSRLIKDYGGVVNRMPIFASFFMLFALANVGLPGTSGFVGEFFVILSAFKAKIWISILAASILILGASYTLWMYKRVIFGPIQHATVAGLQDIDHHEKLIFLLLALVILGLGIWPAPLLNLMGASSTHLIEQLLQSKI